MEIAAQAKMEPWGMWYRCIRIFKNSGYFTVCGKNFTTLGEAKKSIDDGYYWLSQSLKK